MREETAVGVLFIVVGVFIGFSDKPGAEVAAIVLVLLGALGFIPDRRAR